jgi:hypothetical protein
MLDVHPPHHPTHTWRDFLIHIATIVVGLVIAIGLEQTVEFVHRAHQRQELRESLSIENVKISQDCERTEHAMTINMAWAQQVQQIISDAQLHHQPLPTLPADPNPLYDTPDDPVYKAAKSSNQLDLLSRPEIEAYNEIDGDLHDLAASVIENGQSILALRALHSMGSLGSPDFANAAPEDWRALYKGYLAVGTSAYSARYWSRFVRGAEVSITHGDTDLDKIRTAERQFLNLP